MTEAIIVALITSGLGLIGQIIISIKNTEKYRVQMEGNQKLLEYKIDKLSEKQDRYNNLQERTYHLEQLIAVHDEKIKVANNRINDLEKKGDQ